MPDNPDNKRKRKSRKDFIGEAVGGAAVAVKNSPVELKSLQVSGGIRTIQQVMDVVTECMDLLARKTLNEKISRELRNWTDLLATLAMALQSPAKSNNDNVMVNLLNIANSGPELGIDLVTAQKIIPAYQSPIGIAVDRKEVG